MSLIRYKKVAPYTVANKLVEELKLDWSYKEKIEHILDYNYTVVEFKGLKSPSFLMRLTVPVFIVVLILVYIMSPIKWLITGKSRYEHEGKLMKFIKAWNDEVNILS